MTVVGYFDKVTHFYCEKTQVYRYYNCQGRKTLNQWRSVDVCRAFETFDEFVKYRKGNLKNCDLQKPLIWMLIFQNIRQMIRQNYQLEKMKI